MIGELSAYEFSLPASIRAAKASFGQPGTRDWCTSGKAEQWSLTGLERQGGIFAVLPPAQAPYLR